jgi:hypothetical protein
MISTLCPTISPATLSQAGLNKRSAHLKEKTFRTQLYPGKEKTQEHANRQDRPEVLDEAEIPRLGASIQQRHREGDHEIPT